MGEQTAVCLTMHNGVRIGELVMEQTNEKVMIAISRLVGKLKDEISYEMKQGGSDVFDPDSKLDWVSKNGYQAWTEDRQLVEAFYMVVAMKHLSEMLEKETSWYENTYVNDLLDEPSVKKMLKVASNLSVEGFANV